MLDHDEKPSSERYPRFHTGDVELASLRIAQIYGSPVRLSAGPRFDWQVQVAALGPIAVLRGDWGFDLHLAGTVGAHIVALATSGVARASAPNGSADLAPGRDAAVFTPGVPCLLDIPGQLLAVGMRFAPGFLATQLEALTGTRVRAPLAFAFGMSLGAGGGALVERLFHVLAAEMEQGTPLDHPVVMTSLCETLGRALLTGQPHNHSHLLEKPAPPSGPTAVRLVEEYAEANAATPIRMADLAALAGTGVRSIEAAFHARRGTTPAAFLRAKRLELARRTLLADPRIPVARLAQASGFLRPEPFEAAYFTTFKESITETRRRGLVACGAPPAPEAAGAGRLSLLSPREREVCVRVARGMLNKQIAAELVTSEPTVKKQRGRAMKKLGVTSAAELARLLERAGTAG